MFRYITEGGYKKPLVTPEYQEQLDNLAETLISVELVNAQEDFDRVFCPRVSEEYYQERLPFSPPLPEPPLFVSEAEQIRFEETL